ncbi:MAG: ABC transporter ATP-binding protein [Gemmatimonadetes bacterium]|nr:ABC transporter ATP-binding protein [Gemmatimonadota bacterium]
MRTPRPPRTHAGPRTGERKPAIRERVQALRLVPRFLAMVWRTRPSYALAILGCRALSAFGPLALLWVGKLIVDGIVAGTLAADPQWRPLVRLVVLELLIVFAMEVLRRTTSLLESLLGDLFANEMSVRIMRHAATLDLERFEDPAFYDKLQRARRHTMGRVVLLGTVMGIAQQLLTVVSLLAVLLAFNAWLLLILTLAILPAFIGETHFAGLSYSLFYGWTPERRELDYLRLVAASDDTAKEVKLFGLSDWLIERYAGLADRYYAANRALAVRRAVTGVALSTLATVAYYGAVVFILIEAVRGRITIGTFTLLTGSFDRSQGLVSSVLTQAASVYEESLFLQDLYDFLGMRPRTPAVAGARPFPSPVRSGFVFEDVGFRYPDSQRWALRGVGFELAPGDRIALVGENGAGKTTLVKLLTRLYDPTEGRILLDGVDLKEYDLEAVRRAIGVIFQDFVRYDLKLRENIAVGRIEKLDDPDRIADAAGKSLASDVIERLPEGLDHMLGRRFDGGANLSGGEWQKIALARAYMRDAQVLVLDEPTAALDARAEFQVFRRFSELTAGRIAVLISHRFSTVRMADRILVLEGGRVIEQGSHEALLAADGVYADLFKLQAAGYR